MCKYRFSEFLDRDVVIPRPDLRVQLAYHRHVEIVKPAPGSHRREGQIYLQPGEAY